LAQAVCLGLGPVSLGGQPGLRRVFPPWTSPRRRPTQATIHGYISVALKVVRFSRSNESIRAPVHHNRAGENTRANAQQGLRITPWRKLLVPCSVALPWPPTTWQRWNPRTVLLVGIPASPRRRQRRLYHVMGSQTLRNLLRRLRSRHLALLFLGLEHVPRAATRLLRRTTTAAVIALGPEVEREVGATAWAACGPRLVCQS